MRKAQLAAEPLCRRCGALATQVDHITPLHLGGQPFARANIQSLCQQCHDAKSAAERVAAARAARGRHSPPATGVG